MAKKGQIFRKHSAEFKISVILDMRQNRSGLRETETYKEYEQKTADYAKDKWQTVNDGLMVIFTKFAECKNDSYTAEFVSYAIKIYCAIKQ